MSNLLLHENQYLNEKIVNRIAEKCYAMAEQFWQEIILLFTSSPQCTPCIYYSNKFNDFALLKGLEEEMEEVVALSECLNNDFIVVGSLELQKYFDNKSIFGDGAIIYLIARNLEKAIEQQINKTDHYYRIKEKQKILVSSQGLTFDDKEIEKLSYPAIVLSTHREVTNDHSYLSESV
ncbi:hypothetical protein E2L07_18210 [Halalkalibacterium halodurans]|uniref:hypothetical protein n=1 Tax=Halalkalibacterium halodurans TaxID=86665 RepID=UPI0010678211|nr:hypothetical protein [Halalkalibacterium halodurans]TES48801.1 hypothetical protein E2L07_18210 [Halalkalibacterium halodurans]